MMQSRYCEKAGKYKRIQRHMFSINRIDRLKLFKHQ